MSETFEQIYTEREPKKIDWAKLFDERVTAFDQNRDFRINNPSHILGHFSDQTVGKIIPVAWFEPSKDREDDTIELFISPNPTVNISFPHYEVEDALRQQLNDAGLDLPELFMPYSAYKFETSKQNGGGYFKKTHNFMRIINKLGFTTCWVWVYQSSSN